jgi:hypothetical protein
VYCTEKISSADVLKTGCTYYKYCRRVLVDVDGICLYVFKDKLCKFACTCVECSGHIHIQWTYMLCVVL